MDPNDRALLVRHEEAERLDSLGVRLYADHDTTGGALSGNRAYLPAGADGPPPHFHTTSAELFFMLGGHLRVLAGQEILDIAEGDFLLVPTHMTHAWAAADDSPADVLVIFTPGLERFDYFRLGDRVIRGQADPAEILATQDRFDNHFVDSPVWREARGTARRPLLSSEYRTECLSGNGFRDPQAQRARREP
jgi:quercetin dioxygenase-like cupin family protein